jgi:hypothetical protein
LRKARTPSVDKLRRLVYIGLQTHYPNIAPLVTEPSQRLRDRDWPMFTVCKRTVLSRSSELARSLLEIEDEINLCGMLPLPLLCSVAVLSPCILAARPLTEHIGTTATGVLLAVITLAVEFYLVYRFYWRRLEEEETCYEMFLLLESGLVAKPEAARERALLTEVAYGDYLTGEVARKSLRVGLLVEQPSRLETSDFRLRK